jgi:hypothetical protein
MGTATREVGKTILRPSRGSPCLIPLPHSVPRACYVGTCQRKTGQLAVGICYSVVPQGEDYFVRSHGRGYVGEGGSHSVTVGPRHWTISPSVVGGTSGWTASRSRLSSQLPVVRVSQDFERGSREPLPRRRRLGLTPTGTRRRRRGRGGPPSVEPERRFSPSRTRPASDPAPGSGPCATWSLPAVA